MLDASIMVRVSTETHNQLKEACQQNKRSMQSVVVALIEGWLENGAPEPFGYGAEKTDSKPIKAEESLEDLLHEVNSLNTRDLEVYGFKIKLLTRKVAALEESSLEILRLEQELEKLKSEISSLNKKLIKVNRLAKGEAENNPFVPLVTDE
jgi:hypothetical protein